MAPLHWNVEIIGAWSRLHLVEEVSSYISQFLEHKPGVYRLVGLAEADLRQPATLDRICGRDETGTLYIGREGKNFAVRSRLSQTMRSLRQRGRYSLLSTEHNAGYLLRTNTLLSRRFPNNKLAVAWSYDDNPSIAENNLLVTYVESFGEAPPLNRQQGSVWIYPETMSSVPPQRDPPPA